MGSQIASILVGLIASLLIWQVSSLDFSGDEEAKAKLDQIKSIRHSGYQASLEILDEAAHPPSRSAL
jgi:hypothetical protein